MIITISFSPVTTLAKISVTGALGFSHFYSLNRASPKMEKSESQQKKIQFSQV